MGVAVAVAVSSGVLLSAPVLARGADEGVAYHCAGGGGGDGDAAVPILFLHGVGLSADCWAGQVSFFVRSGRVYAVDLPGHGASPALTMPVPTVADYINVIKNFVARVVRQPVFVVGHSFGALLALHFAAQCPQLCRAVTALNAVYQRSADARTAAQQRVAALQNGADNTDATIARWFGDNADKSENTCAAYCRAWLRRAHSEEKRGGYIAAYRLFAESDNIPDEVLSAITAPVLFLTGSDDPHSTAVMSRNLSQQVGDGTAQSIAGGRHLIQLTHKDEVNYAIKNFFNNISNGNADGVAQ